MKQNINISYAVTNSALNSQNKRKTSALWQEKSGIYAHESLWNHWVMPSTLKAAFIICCFWKYRSLLKIYGYAKGIWWRPKFQKDFAKRNDCNSTGSWNHFTTDHLWWIMTAKVGDGKHRERARSQLSLSIVEYLGGNIGKFLQVSIWVLRDLTKSVFICFDISVRSHSLS